jgi:serine/threonine-protein kinase
MDDARQAQLISLALLRGLLSAQTLREAAAAPGSMMDHLVERGFLDDEDIEILQRLAPVSQDRTEAPATSEGHEVETSPLSSAPEMAIASSPWSRLSVPLESDNDSGRLVQRVIKVEAWRQYRNLRFLAEGGMGRVFRAFDPSLKRLVALKFIRREEPELMTRFVLEAQNQALVEHPNVCRVYEVGEWLGQGYIAMQFVKGEQLGEAAPAMSLEEKIRVMEQVAEGVHAAHRQGLIHRDLKPANILVEREEKGWKPTILDFGLSRCLDVTGLTQQGLVIGTVHYMAPEQARGENDKVTRRTDVYGLGATLHKLLTGQPPHGGSEGLEALRMSSQEDVPSLKQLVPELSEDLDTVVRKCLEHDPVRRYESALAVAEDLRRWREGEPILARKPTPAYLTLKWARRHRLVVVVAAVALVALVGLGAFAAFAASRERTRARWVQHFGLEAERIESLLRLAHVMPFHDIRPQLDQARQRMTALEAEATKAGRLAQPPAAYALGRGYLALGDPEKAKELLEQAWAGGLRAPEVALALGRCYGAVYRLELARARALGSKEYREARTQEVGRTLRDPALQLLREGAASALEAPGYHEALLAFYGGRWEEARAKAKRAFAQTSWVYESVHLEGQILLEQSKSVNNPALAAPMVEAAASALREVQALAPSDPGPYLDEALAWRQLVKLRLEVGADPLPALARCRETVARVQRVHPNRPEGPAILASAVAAAGHYNAAPLQVRNQLLVELDLLSQEALRLGPGTREALSARATALLGAASRAWVERPQDPTPFMDEAFGLIQQGIARFPQDPTFLLLQVDYYHRRMTRAMYGGLSPWSSFEGGLSTAAQLLDRYPELNESRHRLQAVWVERGEYERTHGLDPRASVAQALRLIDQAEAQGFQGSGYAKSRGDALLIRGQYLVRRQDSGEEDLRKAIGAFSMAFALNPNEDTALVSAAEAAVWIAEAQIARGLDPEATLTQARNLLDRGRPLREEYYYRPYIEGLMALQRGRWKALRNEDPTGDWALSERNLRHSLRLRAAAQAGVALAELESRRYLLGGRFQDRLRALASARSALLLDARNAEAHLWLAVAESVEARSKRPGATEAVRRSRQACEQALAFDRNLVHLACRLGLLS